MILIFMTLINILFLNFNNPMIMGILMLIQTFLLILLMGKIFYSFWFSYIIFLVFIGGLFILFIYMISLIFNNKFFILKNYLLIIMLSFFLLINYKTLFFNNYETNNNFINSMINKENLFNTLKLYNFPNNYINIMLIIYLFLLMVIVVKITNFFLGPIRTNSNNN